MKQFLKKIGEIEALENPEKSSVYSSTASCVFWGRSCVWKSAKGSRLHYASGSGVGKSTVITATLLLLIVRMIT